jgi:hypothetical protein
MSDFPGYYHPGSRLSIRLAGDEGSNLLVTVVHVFTSFTMGQVFVVRQPKWNFHSSIYWHAKHRNTQSPASSVTTSSWKADLHACGLLPTKSPLLGNALRCGNPIFKISISQKMMTPQAGVVLSVRGPPFRDEAAAYVRLKPLQGTTVPRCFASGTMVLTQRFVALRMLLLEYFPELGVVHTDLNSENILFVHGVRPTRAVVIDFADSAVRRPD